MDSFEMLKSQGMNPRVRKEVTWGNTPFTLMRDLHSYDDIWHVVGALPGPLYGSCYDSICIRNGKLI